MSVRIGSNIGSLQAQRRLSDSSTALSKAYEKLSSGSRINRASDDPAGLAIAESLNVKSRVYTQGIRNGNDGFSVLSVADSALESLAGIVTRIRELSTQSANGTYSQLQRSALDKEAQALSDEYQRIAQSTSFNGIKLFDGSLGSGLRIQLGSGVEGSINTGVGGSIGTGTFTLAQSFQNGQYAVYAIETADLNGDGIQDLITADQGAVSTISVRLGTGSGAFGAASSTSISIDTLDSIKVGDVNNDGKADIVASGFDGSAYFNSILLGNGTGGFNTPVSLALPTGSGGVELGDLNGDGNLDIITGGSGSVNIRLGNGDGTFKSNTTFASTAGSEVKLADLDNDGFVDIIASGTAAGSGRASVHFGNGNGTFDTGITYSLESNFNQGIALGDLNGDGKLDLVSIGYGGGVPVSSVRLGTGNGSFGTSTSFLITFSGWDVKLGDLNGDGRSDLIIGGNDNITADGSVVSVRLGNGDGTFMPANTFLSDPSDYSGAYAVAVTDLDEDGCLDLIVAGYSAQNLDVSVFRANTTQGISSLIDFSLKTKSGSLQAMGIMDSALSNISKQRGVIGSHQSRLSSAVNNLTSSVENFKSAESRIRDADIASEAAEMVRLQILQQSGAAILAQANSNPQIALQILRI